MKIENKSLWSPLHVWLTTHEYEACPGVVDIPSVTLLGQTDFSLSQQVKMTIRLSAFTQEARFLFINSSFV